MARVDARVDHRDAHIGQRREVGPGVEGMDAVEVPLAHRERVVRREREPAGIAHALDPGDTANRAEPAGTRCVDREREGADRRDSVSRAGLELLRDEPGRSALLKSDGVAGRSRGGGRRQREQEETEGKPFHAGPIRSVALTPGTKPRPGASLAR